MASTKAYLDFVLEQLSGLDEISSREMMGEFILYYRGKVFGGIYIGSATGEEGVAQRWGNYLDSKHGGNKKLIALYERKGSEYFEKYFTYTLLEYFGLSYDPIKILEREQYWKKCLDTIRNGYNDN